MIIKHKKIYALTAENPCKLGTHRIIKISMVLYSTYIIPRNQDKFVFYINNYIDWNQFNQLYNPK